MHSAEQPKLMETSPSDRLKSVEKKLKGLVVKRDFEIANLSYQQVIDTLQYALKKGKTWPVDRILSLEGAVDGYIAAGNAHRMDALLELKEQLAEALSDVESRRKAA